MELQEISANELVKIGDLLRTIYVAGANLTGLGLLNTVHVLLAYIASSANPKMTRFTILDPGEVDYVLLKDSPFLNGEIISNDDEILDVLETATTIKFDFQNVIVLNHYDWLKNSTNGEYNKRIRGVVQKLVEKAREQNCVLIVVDRNVEVDYDLPDFDAVLCFKLENAEKSRKVLGQEGAEKLADKGDSLYYNRRTGQIIHGQIPLLKSELINTILQIE